MKYFHFSFYKIQQNTIFLISDTGSIKMYQVLNFLNIPFRKCIAGESRDEILH
jgi:hypothetical protein